MATFAETSKADGNGADGTAPPVGVEAGFGLAAFEPDPAAAEPPAGTEAAGFGDGVAVVEGAGFLNAEPVWVAQPARPIARRTISPFDAHRGPDV